MMKLLQRLLCRAAALHRHATADRAPDDDQSMRAQRGIPSTLMGLLAAQSPMPAFVLLQPPEPDAERAACAQQRRTRGW